MFAVSLEKIQSVLKYSKVENMGENILSTNILIRYSIDIMTEKNLPIRLNFIYIIHINFR